MSRFPPSFRTSAFGGSVSVAIPPIALPARISSNFPSRSISTISMCCAFISARTNALTSGRETSVAYRRLWLLMTRPPSAKRWVMMCGLSSPESSVWTWKTWSRNFMLLLKPTCALRKLGFLISASRRASSSRVYFAIAASSSPCSPAIPSIRSKADFATAALGSIRSASARSVCPSWSLGPLTAQAVRTWTASSVRPFARSHLATRDAEARGVEGALCAVMTPSSEESVRLGKLGCHETMARRGDCESSVTVG